LADIVKDVIYLWLSMNYKHCVKAVDFSAEGKSHEQYGSSNYFVTGENS